MKMKQVFATVIVAAVLFGFPQFANAGNNPNSNNSNNSNRNINGHNKPSTEVPFDGGLSLLLAAGLGIGIKKGYDRRKKQIKTSLEDKG